MNTPEIEREYKLGNFDLWVHFDFKLQYQGKGIDNKTTIYRFTITSNTSTTAFEGIVHKHNGQFVYIDGYLNYRDDQINFICEDVVLDTEYFLKEYIYLRIRNYIIDINYMNKAFSRLAFLGDVPGFEDIMGDYEFEGCYE